MSIDKSIDKTLRRISRLREKLNGRISDLGEQLSDRLTDLGDHFDELHTEIRRRFGAAPRERAGEIFRQLPEPSGMEMSVLDALTLRRTERNFSDEPLSDQMLSNLLYAADGINRRSGRRTTPTTFDWRETEIYVLKSNGIWRWVPERRGLLFCAMRDVREAAYLVSVPFSLPPVVLVYVTNLARTRSLLAETVASVAPKISAANLDATAIEEIRMRSTELDAGAKLQSVYLAAAAMELACVARTGFSTERLARELHLRPDEVIAAAQSVGIPAKSLLDHIK